MRRYIPVMERAVVFSPFLFGLTLAFFYKEQFIRLIRALLGGHLPLKGKAFGGLSTDRHFVTGVYEA